MFLFEWYQVQIFLSNNSKSGKVPALNIFYHFPPLLYAPYAEVNKSFLID